MDGYTEARKIDDQMQRLMKKHPPVENIMDWLNFIRTIRTSLELLEYDLCGKGIPSEGEDPQESE